MRNGSTWAGWLSVVGKGQGRENGQKRGKGAGGKPNVEGLTAPWFGTGKGGDVTVCFGQCLSHQPFPKFGVRYLVDSGPSLDGCCHRDLKKVLLCTAVGLAV